MIEEFATLDEEIQELLTTLNYLFLGVKMSKTNKEFIKQKRVGDLSKVKLMAPSPDGGPDREVTVVYQRKAHYGMPSFLKVK
ncbi:hypothetical protein [Paenibacillus terrae]|uniref:hypothetical protein n=1 Tax=Paenibacillus terrae TaxID=159743 RepID=UPI0011EB40E1|nr:hypothetical protein [Paenibacillus terrae]